MRGVPDAGLSEREQSVLIGVVVGKTSTQIGNELLIASKTVDTYRSRIMAKLAVTTRADLIHKVLDRLVCGHCGRTQIGAGFKLPPLP